MKQKLLNTTALTPMKEWWTAAELASALLRGLPTTKQGVLNLAERDHWRDRRDVNGNRLARRRKGRGGGWEYHYTVLPVEAQTALVARHRKQAPATTTEPARGTGEMWDWYERQSDRKKDKAKAKLATLHAVHALRRGGLQLNVAVCEVARQEGIAPRTIYNWMKAVEGVDRSDWLPWLCGRHTGRTATVDCDAEAWALIKRLYLTQSQQPFKVCYRDLEMVAEKHGWTIPSMRTLQRKIEREIPAPVRKRLREGPEAMSRMFPAQERDRSMLHAMQAVNIDGHKWDVFVRWPDGTVGRPIMVAIQDLYSNKMLAWRIDRSENTDLVRLTFKDLFEQFGIPDSCLFDNGRAFASKYITGGAPNRYRFKVKPEDPVGMLVALDVEVKWATPYSGQSKPIERAFRDFCNEIAKHVAFEGAYTGNSSDAKPENYGNRAIPLDDFLKVVGPRIQMWNARPGRKTRVCGGTMSFDQAFDASYAKSIIRQAGPDKLAMCMLAAQSVTARKPDGSIHLLENRYWAEFLSGHIGQKLIVRFDPENLHDGVRIYRLDGVYLGFADCKEAVGFANAEAARQQSARRNAWKRKNNEMAQLEQELTAGEAAALLAEIETGDEPDVPQNKVVRAIVGNTARAAVAVADPDVIGRDEFREMFHAGLQVVQGGREE